MYRIASLAVLCFLLQFAASAADGSLSGSVKFQGPIPPPRVVVLDAAHAAGCPLGAVHLGPEIDPVTTGIASVVVRVINGASTAPAPAPALALGVISQAGCKFTPSALIVAPGSEIDVLNPNHIAHNVHTIPLDGENLPFNRMCPADAEKLTIPKGNLKVPELIQVQCDIHPWMKGLIVVHDPRFATLTAANGTFAIRGLAPGKYKVVITEKDLGEQEKDVEIKDGADTALDTAFKQK